jgi:hypothetical protein
MTDEMPRSYLPAMFIVTEADAAAIRAIFEQEGELSAAIELRRRMGTTPKRPLSSRQQWFA